MVQLSGQPPARSVSVLCRVLGLAEGQRVPADPRRSQGSRGSKRAHRGLLEQPFDIFTLTQSAWTQSPSQSPETKYHRQGGLTSRKLCSHLSGGWKSKIRCPRGWVPVRSHGPAQAVVKQPVRGATGRTTVTAIVQTGGDWSTGLFSVCRDKRICFCGLFCPICLECDIARHHGECLCWPLLPGSTFALRIGTRERHKIRATLCEDWLAVHCCWPLAVCQLARELRMRAARLHEISAAPSARDSLV